MKWAYDWVRLLIYFTGSAMNCTSADFSVRLLLELMTEDYVCVVKGSQVQFLRGQALQFGGHQIYIELVMETEKRV